MPGLNNRNLFTAAIAACSLFISMDVCAQREPLNVSLHYGHPDMQLEAVALDQDQQVYLASNHGFYVYDGRSLKEWSWLKKKSSVGQLYVTGDSLIIGYDSGELAIVLIGDERMVLEIAVSDVPIIRIGGTPSGAILLGTAGNGVHLISPTGERDSVVAELSDPFINDWYYDREGQNLTVATDRGIDRLKVEKSRVSFVGTVQAKHDLVQSVIPAIDSQNRDMLAWSHARGFVTLQGEHWIPTDLRMPGKASHGNLLNGLDHTWLVKDHNEIYHLSGSDDNGWSAHKIFSFDDGVIVKMEALKEGYLMVWMQNGELHLIPATYSQFNQISGTPLNGISAVCASSTGGVWVARQDSLLELSVTSGEPKIRRTIAISAERKFPIISLSEYKNHLFAGSFGDGLFVIDLGTGEIQTTLDEASGLDNNSILDIAHSRNQSWISTMSGVHEVQLSPELEITDLTGAPGYVYCLETSPNGRLYVGSQGESMFVNEGNTLNHAVPGDTTAHSIVSIQIDAADRVWGLTTESQLFQFSEEGIVPHELNDQLQTLGAYRLFLSPLGHLGLISESALFDITPEGVAYELLGGPGLFKSDFQHISAVDDKNNLWLARPDGMVLVEDHALTSFHFPQTNIASARIDRESQDLNTTGDFAHSVSDIEFELKSVWHDPYRPVVREYRMLGLDTTWRTVVENHLHFVRLAPGKYNLEVRTLFGPTLNPVHRDNYAFAIAPPFYFQWWFVVLVLTGIALILILAIRYRDRRIAAAMELKSERIQSQFEVLKNQINPHFLFNSFNTLAALIPDDPKKAERFTEKLSAFFREILSTQDQETNTLERELELAEDFIFLQHSRYEDSLVYKTEIDPTKLKCALPTLALQILLENSIKHNQISKAAPLQIRVFTENQTLVVTNNLQPRPTPAESTGVGLNNLSNRLQILTGKDLVIDQSDGIFKVTIPLVKCD